MTVQAGQGRADQCRTEHGDKYVERREMVEGRGQGREEGGGDWCMTEWRAGQGRAGASQGRGRDIRGSKGRAEQQG